MRRQPSALFILFLTEMWERFGFYIIQILLVLYMVNELDLSDAQSNAVLGSYTALVYISPLLGGYLANNLLGYRRSILLGGVLLSLGYAILAMHGHTMFWGLSTVVVGNGFFKPNISAFLGDFYDDHDRRRESGFTIFYVGINLGGLFGTAMSGYLREPLGYHACYAFASVGMLIGLIIFIVGRRHFKAKGFIPEGQLPEKLSWLGQPAVFAVMLLVMLVAVRQILESATLAGVLLTLIAVLTLVMLLFQGLRFDRYWRNRMLALVLLIIISVFYWALFFEQFDIINLFVDRTVDRKLLGFTVPTTTFVSFEQFFVIVIGPVMAMYWQYLDRKRRNPKVSIKFALSMLFIGVGFAVLYFGSYQVNAKFLVSGWWLVLCYFFIAVSEMFLSPIGLSIVTELAHPKLTALLMGVWFMALGFGGKLAGVMATWGAVPKSVTDPAKIISIYQQAFFWYMVAAAIMAVVVMIMVPYLNRLISAKPKGPASY